MYTVTWIEYDDEHDAEGEECEEDFSSHRKAEEFARELQNTPLVSGIEMSWGEGYYKRY